MTWIINPIIIIVGLKELFYEVGNVLHDMNNKPEAKLNPPLYGWSRGYGVDKSKITRT